MPKGIMKYGVVLQPFLVLIDQFYPSEIWSSPEISGTSPPPCSSFTLTMIDEKRALLFGGYVPGRGKNNDIYLLDLKSMVGISVQILAT